MNRVQHEVFLIVAFLLLMMNAKIRKRNHYNKTNAALSFLTSSHLRNILIPFDSQLLPQSMMNSLTLM